MIKNKINIFLVLMVVITLFFNLFISFSEVPFEKALEDSLKKYDFIEKSKVSLNDKNISEVNIDLNLKYYDKYTIYDMVSVVDEVGRAYNFSKLTLNIYDSYLPYVKFEILKSDYELYKNGELDKSEFISKFKLSDMRSLQKILYDDLVGFDSYILDIKVNGSMVVLSVEFNSKKEEFFDEFYAMALVVVEDAPFIDTVRVEYKDDSDNVLMTLTSSKDKILALLLDEISMEAFLNGIDVVVNEDVLKDSVVEDKDSSENISNKDVNGDESSDLGDSMSDYDEDFVIVNATKDLIKGNFSDDGSANLYKLNVEKDAEYRISVDNFDDNPLLITVLDGDFNTVKDNLNDESIDDYLYVDLIKGREYYIMIMPAYDDSYGKEFSVNISESEGILAFLIGAIIFISLFILSIILIIKKISKKAKK